MKKITALVLCTILILSAGVSSVTVKQAYALTDKAKQVITALGIMKTDREQAKGTDSVSRARFAQMLVNMSVNKELVSKESNVSLFNDVSKKHWASGYIQTAINQGWMYGYLNGNFKPDKGITLQEAINGIVKLLGYTNNDFSGNLAGGQMALYVSKGLNKNIDKSESAYLTEADCINLFYNTLNARTKDGKLYAEVLGYTISQEGELDYLSLVNEKTQGPVIADDNWRSEIPFSTSDAIYYRNSVECQSTEIEEYDVIYYSESLKTIWAYDNKVTGRVEKINPNHLAPETITVAGKDYTLGTSKMSEEFSTLGSVTEGDIITLLLGKDNTVVEALNPDEYHATITGVALSTGEKMVEKEDGIYVGGNYVVVVDAAGNEYTQDYIGTDIFINKGDMVNINFEEGKVSVSRNYYESGAVGNNTFNSQGTILGGIRLASNVKILDFTNVGYISVYPDRLAGVVLISDPIYYKLNENREISELILDDATGDLYRYGIFTGFDYQGNKSVLNYLIDGETGSVALESITNNSNTAGPQGFEFNGDTMTSTFALTGEKVKSTGNMSVQLKDTVYPLAESYDVYYLKDGNYTKTTLDKVSDLKKYELTAYYDRSVSLGGRIRIIIAESQA